jgi:hypothetical protein
MGKGKAPQVPVGLARKGQPFLSSVKDDLHFPLNPTETPSHSRPHLRLRQPGHPGIAYRAVAVDSGFAILHPHPNGVLHLPPGFALEAVAFHHTPPYGSYLTLGVPILLHGQLGGTLAK